MEEVTTNTNVTGEPQSNAQATPQTDQAESSQEPEVTIESLMAELAQEKAARAKEKAALDKALKEKGDITKQYREVLSDQQKAKIDQANADEEHKQYVSELEAFKRKTEAKDRYIVQGMSPEMATEAAEAEVSGDMDKLAEIQKQNTEILLKKARAEWQESIPQPQFGTGEYSSMTKEQIMAIGNREERRKAIAQNMNLFE